ncbi:MAG TPA: hypothetical protein VHP83_19195 [Aggregatilineaceae bacterium]|nr:hypothetical protein [Aggregatilineaceae bacterium]
MSSFLVIYVALWTLIGAIFTPILFRRRGMNTRLGLLVGLVAGLIGQLTALGPLWLFVGLGRDPIIHCPDCGQSMPRRSADECPNCGYQPDQPTRGKTNDRSSEIS